MHNCFAGHTEEGDGDEDLSETFLVPDIDEIVEMADEEAVLNYKLERLVNLLRLSRRTVVFTRSSLTTDKHYGTECGIRFIITITIQIIFCLD